jgi:hypothetical protein
MSGQPQPPAAVAAMAATYTCGSCDAEIGRPHLDHDGIWHMQVHHDESCPVLTGAVSPAHDGIRAMRTAAAVTGEQATYLGTTP